MIVGEQPGDHEDRAGEPFVGPAAKLLDRALDEAGIDRATVYVTNAAQHFAFRRAERGRRRIHQKPSRTEVVACRPWLLAELKVVEPDLVLRLGATAAQSLLGPDLRVIRERGKVLELPDSKARVVSTVDPSAVLRAADRESAYQDLVADLRSAAAVLQRTTRR